ncbi:class I SAM-dependent methyltransferase [Paenibacillus popilliae]|uniref:Class I SAM-dependent methyltransferase n=1 Tax=Paenibacillus popilliae TaxID=78057 RepID=A0ABY3ALT0_PAEPP|nr:class I SAM-dependent methyltransferase [Paenibacillus sp. SDF0028]TQR42689.1 class I SAM-dependent methyltransferase [Paenibacillus sp. SDF0028]
MSNFKAALAQSYDQDAQRRSSRSLSSWKIDERKKFRELISREGKTTILEIGAGTGIDGVYFQQSGMQTTCIDLSSESVKKYIERGLNAKVMDFYQLDFCTSNRLRCGNDILDKAMDPCCGMQVGNHKQPCNLSRLFLIRC